MKILAWPSKKNSKRNPYQSLLYSNMENVSNCSILEFTGYRLIFERDVAVLHIHWPDAFISNAKPWIAPLKALAIRAIILVAKVKGIKVVWTAHNYRRFGQRNSRVLDKMFWPTFLRSIDGIIYLTESSKTIAAREYSDIHKKPSAIIPHGVYEVADKLDIDEDDKSRPVILFFGSITPYKNAGELLNSFSDLDPGSADLWILGKMSAVDPDLYLEEIFRHLPDPVRSHVRYENRFLADSELMEAVHSATLVVLPYKDVINSGSAMYSISAGTPVLASGLPLFHELAETVGDDWVTTYDEPLTAGILREAIDHAARLKDSGARPNLEPFAWRTIAAQTTEFFASLIKH